MTKYLFYYSPFRPFHQQQKCGNLVDNIAGVTMYVLDDNVRESIFLNFTEITFMDSALFSASKK